MEMRGRDAHGRTRNGHHSCTPCKRHPSEDAVEGNAELK
jgi:hypothetical protein